MYIVPTFRKMLNLDCKKYKFKEIYHDNLQLAVEIQGKYSTASCPHCGEKTSKRKDKGLQAQKQRIKHMNYGGNQVIELILFKRRFRCNTCSKSFHERFDFESQYGNYSRDFEKYVIWSFGFLSGNKIAELYQSSSTTIYRILERIEIGMLVERGLEIMSNLDEIYLGVDEHSFSGHDMVLIITELKTKQILAVLDGVTNEKLNTWLEKIPVKTQVKIRGFSTDMNKGYAKLLDQIVGKPIHSVDKYHLFQEANRVVDEVRQIAIWGLAMNFITIQDIPKLGKKIGKKLTKKDIQRLNEKKEKNTTMKKYKDKREHRLQAEHIHPHSLINRKGETVEYREITADYFIEKGYRKLFMYREKNTSPIQKLRLNQIMQEFDYLGFIQESWTIKEDFMDGMDELNLSEIDRIIADCLGSEHYRIKKFGKTLTRWYKGIQGFCDHSTPDFKFTNALTEGVNNLCKGAKRQSHGFRTKDMYIRKLTARFCLKNLNIYS